MKETLIMIVQNWVNAIILIVAMGSMMSNLKEDIHEEKDIVVNEYYVCEGDTMLVDIIIY